MFLKRSSLQPTRSVRTGSLAISGSALMHLTSGVVLSFAVKVIIRNSFEIREKCAPPEVQRP